MDRIHAYLEALKVELVNAEREVEQGFESRVKDVEAEIRRVEVELGIAKPASNSRRTPDATAEKVVNTPGAERA